MHGAGVIDEIVTETIAGARQDYYVFRMPVGGLTLKIPTSSGETSGLRGVWDTGRIQKLIQDLSGLEVERPAASWNQRYRDNMEQLKSGDLYQVAKVVKGLLWRERERGLSTGERKMLRTAKQILISEMALSTGEAYSELERRVHTAAGGASV